MRAGGGRRLSRRSRLSPRSSTPMRCRAASRSSPRCGWSRCWPRWWRTRGVSGLRAAADRSQTELATCSRWPSQAPPASRPSASRWRRGSGRCFSWHSGSWSGADRGRRADRRAGGGVRGGVLLLSVPTLVDLGDYLDIAKDVVTARPDSETCSRRWTDCRCSGSGSPGTTGSPRRLARASTIDADPHPDRHCRSLWARSDSRGCRAARDRPAALVAASLIALWYVTRTGSPWADGKALAIAAPAVLLAAALGPVAIEGRAWRNRGRRRRCCADRGRRDPLERLRLPRRQPRSARPAGGARRARRAHGRQGPAALHRVRGVRQALPARG